MELSATRLYASSIAIVSGTYSLVAAGGAIGQAPPMTGGLAALGIGGLVMLVVGLAVLFHGIALITPAAARIRRVSGPLMIFWALIMLGNQALLRAMPGWGMGGSMGGPMGGSMASPLGWDPGMVAIALLMLSSGLIMTRGRTAAGM